MKIIRNNDFEFIPASHENPKDPGCLKKVLVKRDDLVEGRLQMINWSILPKGKSFAPHYHEGMEEVFILLNGKAEIKINDEVDIVETGDAVIVPIMHVHSMKNLCNEDILYVAIGIVTDTNGKTIVV